MTPGRSGVEAGFNREFIFGRRRWAKSDSTAIGAVKFDQNSDKLVIAGHWIWQPRPGEILDLGSTLEFFIRGLSQRATIVKLLYDPSQAQRSMQMFREWFELEELAQT